jgi:competence protein ComEA
MIHSLRAVSLLLVLLLALPAAAAGAPPRAATATGTAMVGSAGAVNINTADVKDLMRLKGVGKKLAESIVQYRDANGPFKNAEDLKRVKGVGHGLLERNRERIVVK